MSTTTLETLWKVGGVLTDATSVKLSSEDGTYGVKRTDNDAVVVADGTDMTRSATGVYEHSWEDPTTGLTYEYSIEVVYNGRTYYHVETVLGGTSTSAATGITGAAIITEAKRFIGVRSSETSLTGTSVIQRARDLLHIREKPASPTAISASDVISDARELLNDTDSDNYRNSTALLTAFVSDACQFVVAEMPSVLVEAAGTQASGTSAALIDFYQEALVHYVVSRVCEIDSSDEQNATRVAFHRQMAQAIMRSYNQVPLAVLVGFMNDGVHAVLAQYPYLASYTEMSASSYSGALPFGAEFRDALAHFIAARVLEGHKDVEAASQRHYEIAMLGMRSRRPDSLTSLIACVNAAVQDVLARRPDLLLQSDGTLDTFTELTTGTYDSQSLPVDERYREGLAHYVAARIYELGPEDEGNMSRAARHRQLYRLQT